MHEVASGARYAKINISGSETVKFPCTYNVFGVKGENITVKLSATASGDGVYSTADTDGEVLIAHYANLDTLYLVGTGDVIVWAGNSPLDCPFKSGGKGGVRCLGTTTTELYDGSTANPIVIDGVSVTAKRNDIAFYADGEFMFNGTSWSKFGDLSGLGALAYKDNASGTAITSAGTLPSFTYDSVNEGLIFSAGTLPQSGMVTVS